QALILRPEPGLRLAPQLLRHLSLLDVLHRAVGADQPAGLLVEDRLHPVVDPELAPRRRDEPKLTLDRPAGEEVRPVFRDLVAVLRIDVLEDVFGTSRRVAEVAGPTLRHPFEDRDTVLADTCA